MQEAQLTSSPSPETVSEMRSWLKVKLSKELSLGAPASSMFEPKLKESGFNLPPEFFGADLITLNSPRERC